MLDECTAEHINTFQNNNQNEIQQVARGLLTLSQAVQEYLRPARHQLHGVSTTSPTKEADIDSPPKHA